MVSNQRSKVRRYQGIHAALFISSLQRASPGRYACSLGFGEQIWSDSRECKDNREELTSLRLRA
jgi:hypothetical protein